MSHTWVDTTHYSRDKPVRRLIRQHNGNTLELEVYNGKYYIHCTIVDWKPSIYKEYKNYFRLQLEEWKRQGIDAVYALVKVDNFKLIKFVTFFGLTEVGRLIHKPDGVYVEYKRTL